MISIHLLLVDSQLCPNSTKKVFRLFFDCLILETAAMANRVSMAISVASDQQVAVRGYFIFLPLHIATRFMKMNDLPLE